MTTACGRTPFDTMWLVLETSETADIHEVLSKEADSRSLNASLLRLVVGAADD